MLLEETFPLFWNIINILTLKPNLNINKIITLKSLIIIIFIILTIIFNLYFLDKYKQYIEMAPKNIGNLILLTIFIKILSIISTLLLDLIKKYIKFI
jgi:hypothetical protein